MQAWLARWLAEQKTHASIRSRRRHMTKNAASGNHKRVGWAERPSSGFTRETNPNLATFVTPTSTTGGH